MVPEGKRVSLVEKLALFDEYSSPRIVGELNGQYVKLAKFKGEFVWHEHEHEDELFLVIRGELKISLSSEELTVRAGELAIIPRKTRHRPWCTDEAHVLLFEPKSTRSMGESGASENTQGEWL
jgi:mannose-6-phosphate isomerase-like protein (cupin superfamily)